MRNIVKKAAILAIALMMVAALSAPCAAEMPIPWLQDLLTWYLQQNGVNITVLLPGSGTGSNTNPGTSPYTLEVISGYNAHLLYQPEESCVYNGHFGHLFFQPYGEEASTLHYMFNQWIFPVWWNAGTPYLYSNGQAFETASGPAGSTPMYGTITWMVPTRTIGSGNAQMKISFDFYLNGWRYGGVINNQVEDAWCADEEDYEWISPDGIVWLFWGTFAGVRSNFMSPPTRDSYYNRPRTGNGTNGGTRPIP